MSAALLLHAPESQLEERLYGDTEPRVGLKARRGFWAYELPGALTGSAMLAHPAALSAYAQGIVEEARRDAVRYLELRGSPTKYTGATGDRIEGALRWLAAFRNALRGAGAVVDTVEGKSNAQAEEGEKQPLEVRFVVIADRRHPVDRVAEVVKLAVRAKRELEGFVVGIDLAGDEGQSAPEAFVEAFEPAFEACLHVTVHAGEGEPAERIWEAAYRLHADRVGHGLSLGGHEELCERFRDRGVALEMCPTSNIEVVGYRDPQWQETAGLPEYPLYTLWRRGVPLTVCTDNPGISRTTLTKEYLRAARMCGGMSVWDALAMVKQGFERAFAPARLRERLLKEVDAKIFEHTLALEQR